LSGRLANTRPSAAFKNHINCWPTELLMILQDKKIAKYI